MKDLISYKGYFGSVHFDDKDLFFYGKLEFIRALVTYEATNAKELRQEFERAVDEYLELCKNENLEPEQPFKGSFNVRVGKELHQKIALAAAREDLTINSYIKTALQNVLAQQSGRVN
jgi:predicted HicB family RNase H-like nuclease